VVSERAWMAKMTCAPRIIVAHEIAPAAECAERQSAPEVLSERCQIRSHPQQLLPPTGRETRRLNLVKYKQRSGSLCFRREHGEEGRISRCAASCAEHRLDQYRGEFLPYLAEKCPDAFCFVVGREDE